MLPEPEASLVVAWLDAGGIPTIVPFGISGKVWTFAQTARRSGMWGAFKRYGGRLIESEALPYIACGQLTVAQARVGVAWNTLMQHGPMHSAGLGRALQIDKMAARKVLDELVSIDAGEPVSNARFYTVRAVGHFAPRWTDYLPAEKRAA